MNRAGWAAAALGLGLTLSACFSISKTDSDADAALSIDELSTTATEIGDGESFEVSWKVSHTTKPGYVTVMGLFVGTPDDLAEGSERDSRRLFDVATTAGAPHGAGNSSIMCTRTGTRLQCGTTDGSRDIAGVTDFTFRACTSYVLSGEEVCETRAVPLTFP